MSHDSPLRQPLAPPFSRPTHPGPLPAISPFSEAGRSLRPTPYASAVIPHLVQTGGSAGSAVRSGGDAAMGSPTDPDGSDAVRSLAGDRQSALSTEEDTDSRARALLEWGECPDPRDERRATKSIDSHEEVVAPPPLPPWESGEAAPALERAAAPSLRDLPGDHDHPTGVPPNPEPALEVVDSASDYPDDTPWSSEAVFDWGTRDSEWEVEVGLTDTPTLRARTVQAVAEDGQPRQIPEDLDETGAHAAADTLERVAAAIRSGQLILGPLSGRETTPAILASVLSALLAPAQNPPAGLGGQDGPAARRER